MQVGALIGKGGKNIQQIMASTGAVVSISGKDDLIPGTSDRTVKITGPAQNAHDAHMLVQDKLKAAAKVQRELKA